jgi:hypothetical protein
LKKKGKRIEIANAQSCVSTLPACVFSWHTDTYTTTITLSTREREKRIFSVLSRTMPCVTHNTAFFSNYVPRTSKERKSDENKRERGRGRRRERKARGRRVELARVCECGQELRHIDVDVIKWV